jgi:nitrate/TMAO reductase-like tetraheme cytochrome c subunit
MMKQLHCTECNEMFKVSTEIAKAMHQWREQSGEPFTCGKCAGVPEIYTPDNNPVGASCARDPVGASFTRDLRTHK